MPDTQPTPDAGQAVAEIMWLVNDYARDRELRGMRGLPPLSDDIVRQYTTVKDALTALVARAETAEAALIAARAVVTTVGMLFDRLPSRGTPYDDLADQLAEDLDAFAASQGGTGEEETDGRD